MDYLYYLQMFKKFYGFVDMTEIIVVVIMECLQSY